MNTLIYIIITLTSVSAWDLSAINVNENYYTSGIAIYKGRAFVAIPRSSCYNKLSYPTLVEITWTGETRTPFIIKKIFPNSREQIWHVCKCLQDVVSVDVENNKARLWILDKGNSVCQPKIVIYNLYFNHLIYVYKLKDIQKKDLTSLVLDPILNQQDTIAYVSDPGDNSLIQFSLNKLKAKLIKLQCKSFNIPIGTKFMAISKIEPIMYLTSDNNNDLFSINLKELRNFQSAIVAKTTITINATLVGQKLGLSSALITDLKGGVSYYIIRDYAVMRWDSSEPLMAEYHNLLAQSYDALPYVSCLFTGPQNGIWALVNPQRPTLCSDHNRTLPESSGNYPKLKSRVVKLLKYNDIVKVN